MACEVCGMSCSLCPWCGSDSCPHVSHETPKRYWVYATHRIGSYYSCLYKTNDKKKLLEKVLEIKDGKLHPKWSKNYTTSTILGEKVGNRYPNCKKIETPYVEITITDGEFGWYDAIRLVLNIEEHKLYTYTSCNLTYDTKIEGMKEWNEKIRFVKQNK